MKRKSDNASFEVDFPPSTPASRRISESKKNSSVLTKTPTIGTKLTKFSMENKKGTRNKMIPVNRAKNNSSSNSYSTSFQHDSNNNSKNKVSSTYSTIVLNESPPKKRSPPQCVNVSNAETEIATNSSSVASILKICERIKTLLSTSVKESFDLLNEESQLNKDKLHLDRVLNKALLYYEIENIKKETEDLQSNLKSTNTSEYLINETFFFESTKMNTSLIQISSERRISIYKKFFDICIECLNDLKENIINYNTNINYNNSSVNINNNTYNNINVTPNQSSNSNVNVNLNLNLHTISKMMSKKKLSTKRFAVDDDFDYIDDVNEGYTANVPNQKDYYVNKPKDHNMKYRLYTDGDIDSSDLSRILCLSEEEEKQKAHNQGNFKRLMSKSFLEVNNRKEFKMEDYRKDKQTEAKVRLILNDSDSRIIIDSEEEEYDDDYNDNILSKVIESNPEDLKRRESVATIKQTKFPRRFFKTPTQILNPTKQPNSFERKVKKLNTTHLPRNRNDRDCLIF